MALINTSDSLVVFLCLFQSEFLCYPATGLASRWKEKMERCESLSTEVMQAGGRKLQTQLENQYVADSIFRFLKSYFPLSVARLLDLKGKSSCILFLPCHLTGTVWVTALLKTAAVPFHGSTKPLTGGTGWRHSCGKDAGRARSGAGPGVCPARTLAAVQAAALQPDSAAGECLT